MHNCVIIEDEDHLSVALQLMLQRIAADKIAVSGIAKSVLQAIHLIDDLKPSLVFMDIHLKDGSAFKVLDSVQHKDFHLVFTTAFDEHAIMAFRYSAIDYLLKPVSIPMLEEVIQRIERLESHYIHPVQLNHINTNFGTIPRTIVLATQEGIHLVNSEDIFRCETSGSYTTFFLAGGRKIIVSKSLTSYEDLLCPPVFLRVHQSHLVNISKVRLYEKKGVLMMLDGTDIPVARSKKDAVMAILGV